MCTSTSWLRWSFCFLQSYVPTDAKDERYWEKREKNNVAARRSREARRLKENQIALRTAFLEKENSVLRTQLDEAKAENIELAAEKEILMEKLKQFEKAQSRSAMSHWFEQIFVTLLRNSTPHPIAYPTIHCTHTPWLIYIIRTILTNANRR